MKVARKRCSLKAKKGSELKEGEEGQEEGKRRHGRRVGYLCKFMAHRTCHLSGRLKREEKKGTAHTRRVHTHATWSWYWTHTGGNGRGTNQSDRVGIVST